MQRYFIDANPSQQVALPASVAQHLLKVMRAQAGTQVEVVLNDHQLYLAQLTSDDQLQILKQLPDHSELPVEAILACGLPKTKEKPELIVQKATELGASKIVFFDAARSVSHWVGKKQTRKIERLQKIAQGAAEQSHRTRVPQIEYVPDLATVISQYPATVRLVAWEESAKQGETSALFQQVAHLSAGDQLLTVFGPEGGLTQQEVTQMQAAGFIPVGLGPRILRTETAPLYLMAVLSYALELSAAN